MRWLWVLFGGSLAMAQNNTLRAPDSFTLKAVLSNYNLRIESKPPKAHHINIKAPAVIEDLTNKKQYKSQLIKEDRAIFSLPGSTYRIFQVSLYLCDDANTYCEKHTVQASWKNKLELEKIKPPEKANALLTPQEFKIDEYGFILNAPEKAFEIAKKDRKPLLIDFYGIWCPPCNLLDEEIYSLPEFKKRSEKFVKLKLDADDPVSWPLKSRYRVGGYPTLVFATPDGDEISRLVGFYPKDEFFSVLEKAFLKRDESFEKLLKQAQQGDLEASKQVGVLYLERKDYENAYLYLKHLTNTDLEYEKLKAAEIGKTEDKALLKELLEKSIEEISDSISTLEFLSKLAELHEDPKDFQKKKGLLQKLVALTKKIITNPKKIKGSEWTLADVLTLQATTYEELKEKNLAQKAYEAAAQQYKKSLANLRGIRSTASRGYNLELAYCLGKSGKISQAEKIYTTLQKEYPKEFTFYFSHARLHFELKNYLKAKELSEKALEFSYGDNKLRVVEVVAQSYEALGDKKAALKLVQNTLASIQLPEDKTIRTHRYFNKLKAFEKKLLSL